MELTPVDFDDAVAALGKPLEIIARIDVCSLSLEQLKTLTVDTPDLALRRPLTPWPSEAGIPILVDETVPVGEVWAFDKDGKRVKVLLIGDGKGKDKPQ